MKLVVSAVSVMHKQPYQPETLILRPAIPSLVMLLLRARGRGAEKLLARPTSFIALNQLLVSPDTLQGKDRDRVGGPVSACPSAWTAVSLGSPVPPRKTESAMIKAYEVNNALYKS